TPRDGDTPPRPPGLQFVGAAGAAAGESGARCAMDFHPGPIDGVLWRPLRKYHDPRGWLCELFRHDELPAEFHPVMAYISATEPGVARGPHEHRDQADCFCFLAPGNFKVYLSDTRPASPTYRAAHTAVPGADKPVLLLLPAPLAPTSST